MATFDYLISFLEIKEYFQDPVQGHIYSDSFSLSNVKQ